jgi:hypothetical protein
MKDSVGETNITRKENEKLMQFQQKNTRRHLDTDIIVDLKK